MSKQLFIPSIELVDDTYWVETPQSLATTSALWRGRARALQPRAEPTRFSATAGTTMPAHVISRPVR